MKNILISSTRQWNCGDEFIWFGIRRLLKAAGIMGNFILYNRHPAINPRPRLWSKKFWVSSLQPAYDNSFFLDKNQVIDYAIFAGTPEWSDGVRIRPMLEFIQKNKIRASFVGVGLRKKIYITPLLQDVLVQLTDLMIVRDTWAYESVEPIFPIEKDVCPALFSAPLSKVRTRTSLKKVGIVIQASLTKWHDIPSELAASLINKYRELERHYSIEYIAHYIDDWKYANDLGLGPITHYSSFSEDFVDIYNQFDFIISTRVHGCGIAASLAIPSLLISHDGRSETAKGFLSQIVDEKVSFLDVLSRVSITKQSNELVQHRHLAFERYLKRFQKHLQPLLSS